MGDEECLFIVKGVKLGNSIHYLDLGICNIYIYIYMDRWE